MNGKEILIPRSFVSWNSDLGFVSDFEIPAGRQVCFEFVVIPLNIQCRILNNECRSLVTDQSKRKRQESLPWTPGVSF